MVLDSTVVFNEIMYHPIGENESQLEWIELYNQLAVDMDISDWELSGAVDYKFPDGTIVPGRSHLVVAANPAALKQATGFSTASGPWTGQLSNGGEDLRLYNNDARLMNQVVYDDTGDWPSAPDGGGVTLAKSDRQAASHLAASWTFSPQIGGTPGRDNFVRPGDFTTDKLVDSGATAKAFVPANGDLGLSWTQPAFNDAAWTGGKTGVGFDTRGTLASSIGLNLDSPPDGQPPISMQNVNGSVYVRIPFTAETRDKPYEQLMLRMKYDDGFVAFLNGVEIASAKAPGRNGAAGELSWNSLATASNTATTFQEFDITAQQNLLRPGQNVLAIQGMNQSISNSDVLVLPLLTGKALVEPVESAPLRINEVAAADARDFFVEIVNSGAKSIDLGGMALQSVGETNARYVLPAQSLAPGAFLAVSAQQLGFQPAEDDRLLLVSADQKLVIDGRRVTGRLRGRSTEHDGQWLYPSVATPGQTNAFQFQRDVVINEIMYNPMPKLTIPDTPATYERSTLMPMTWDKWRFNATGASLPANWAQQVYSVDGQNWRLGQGLIGFDTADLGVPINTQLTQPSQNNPQFITYYFQTNLDLTAEEYQPIDLLELSHMIDGGAVFYLNGKEFTRFNMPSGPVDSQTKSVTTISNAARVGPVTIPRNLLQVGTNVLSAELHLRSASASDVAFGAEVVTAREVTPFVPGAPYDERDQLEWIELNNKGTQTVDLSGWTLRDGIEYDFPANTRLGAGEYLVIAADAQTLAQQYPGIRIIGDFSGNLSNHDDRLRLLDAHKNPADDVHYYESGRWPVYADGGAASLELRDPRADNNKAESWAASNDAAKSQWITHTFRGVSLEDVYGRALFNEFVFGLLDAGEFLIDDIRVVQNPSGAAKQLIQNGTFEGDTLDQAPAKWRLIGNHSGIVEADPTQPGNKVLHIVAAGAQGHVHDHAETTFVSNTRIVDGDEYDISFRAKWLAGDSQLNSRLWFNRLSNTVYLPVPERIGTPGARNAAFQANVGPTFDQFRHTPTTPLPSQAVTVTAQADDPDGVQSVKLWWRRDGAAWRSVTMSSNADGLFQGTIPAQTAGSVVQFYVEATDQSGAVSTFPAAGRDSRALYQVEDGKGPSTPIDRLRIVMMKQEQDKYNLRVDRMSNRFLPITLVHNDDVFYDISVRMIGSRWIRPNSGYKVQLHPDQPFYGVHDTIRFDRNGMTEIVMKQMLNRAGGSKSSNYDDLAYLVSPLHTQEMILQLARYENVYLDEQFENGSEGTKWELDDVTVPIGPQGGVEGLKAETEVNQQADIGRTTTFVRQQGDNPEFYRAHLLIKSNRTQDDFESIARLAQAIHQDGDALFAASNEVMDIDLWMRHYAHQSYYGNWDTYGFGRPKNLRIYTRPSDGKFVPFFWDCDLCNFTDTIKKASEPLSRLDEIRDIPHNLRLYWGHMLDLVNRSFNEQYVATWAEHYSELVNNQTHGGDGGVNWTSIVTRVRSRSQQAIRDLERDIPRVNFQVTTNGGQNFSVDTDHVTLEGKGWVDIRQIRLAGTEQPLEAFWPTEDGWRIELPLAFGANPITLETIDYEGNRIASDTITVNSSVGDPVSQSLRVTEVHFNPADPTAAEILAGYTDNDDFEFIELTNIGAQSISLDGVRLLQIVNGNDEQGVGFEFSAGATHQLAAGQSVLVVEDLQAFQYRYGNQLPVAGQWSGGLGNGSEMVTVSSSGVLLQQFTYQDDWHSATDGTGRSLQIIDAHDSNLTNWNVRSSWRPSGTWGGAPGVRESAPGDANHDGVFDSADMTLVLAAGEYEDAIPNNSTFAEGDWNGDGEATSDDMIWAFTYGRYESPPPALPAAAAIGAAGVNEPPQPEPRHVLVTNKPRQRQRVAGRREQRPVTLPDRCVDAIFAASVPTTQQKEAIAPAPLTGLIASDELPEP